MLAVQCKMARVALSIGVRDLALLAKVSPDTVARLERGEVLKERTVEAIRTALEAAGVIFIPQNGGGAGVRLKMEKSDEELISDYMDKGPCLLRLASGGGKRASSLKDALSEIELNKNDPVTIIEVLGQVKIRLDQIQRLIARLDQPE